MYRTTIIRIIPLFTSLECASTRIPSLDCTCPCTIPLISCYEVKDFEKASKAIVLKHYLTSNE